MKIFAWLIVAVFAAAIFWRIDSYRRHGLDDGPEYLMFLGLVLSAVFVGVWLL